MLSFSLSWFLHCFHHHPNPHCTVNIYWRWVHKHTQIMTDRPVMATFRQSCRKSRLVWALVTGGKDVNILWEIHSYVTKILAMKPTEWKHFHLSKVDGLNSLAHWISDWLNCNCVDVFVSVILLYFQFSPNSTMWMYLLWDLYSTLQNYFLLNL